MVLASPIPQNNITTSDILSITAIYTIYILTGIYSYITLFNW